MDTTDFFVKLVNEVESHPFLYNMGMADYGRRDITESAWKEIAKKLKIQPNDCKEKWRNIRSSFLRSRKHRRTGRTYYLSKHLQFLLPFVKQRSVEEAPSSDRDDSAEDSPPSDNNDDSIDDVDTPRRRKYNNMPLTEMVATSSEHALPADPLLPNSPNYYFLLSLLPDLDTMTDDQIRNFKIEVMMLIDRIKKNATTWCIKTEQQD